MKGFSGIGDRLHHGCHAAGCCGRVDRLQRFRAACVRQAVEKSKQVGFVAFDLPFIDAAEMPDQAAAKPGDILAMRVAGRLEGEIALGVRAQRAIVEVGRSHAQDAVVDDHHLAVHHDRGSTTPIPCHGIEKTNPVHHACRHKLCDESAAAGSHTNNP